MIIEYRNDKAAKNAGRWYTYTYDNGLRVTFAEYQGSVAEIEELGRELSRQKKREVRMKLKKTYPAEEDGESGVASRMVSEKVLAKPSARPQSRSAIPRNDAPATIRRERSFVRPAQIASRRRGKSAFSAR